jgi:hypothetical protein
MRNMRHRVALACLLAACAASGQAHAETREVAGETLVLTTTTSAATVIGTDRSLSGHVRVTMDGNAACLSVSGGSDAVIATSGCSDDSGTLRVDIPPDMPMTVTANGDGNLHFGDTQAPLILTVNGGSAVQAGRVGRLVLSLHGSSDVVFGSVQGDASLQMTGSGDVRLGGVTGTLVLKHHGDGDLVVGHIEAPALDIESTGSGNELIGAGHVGTLIVRIQGDGDLALAAPVHDADISAYGGGDVKLGVVTGALHKSFGDNSDIIIGGPAMVDTLIGKVAQKIGDDHESNANAGHDFMHFLMFVAVCVMVFIIWRIVRRGGGRTAPPQAGMPHPGVVAVTETLKRIEERLGRVEGYVTSREFDLQQKFKKL